MSPLVDSLMLECRRVGQDCTDTAASFYIWLRWLRGFRACLWFLGAMAAAVAASAALKADPAQAWLVAMAAIAAAGFPAIVKALKLDEAIVTYSGAAARLSNLRAEARQAVEVWCHLDETDFRHRAEQVLDGLAKVRLLALTPPELCFRLAVRKRKAGDYDYDDGNRGMQG